MASNNSINTQQVEKSASNSTIPQPKRTALIIAIIGGILFLALLIVGVVFLLRESTPTSTIRDIFIIFMALESLVIGVALIILIAQIASLMNLLQNEIKPILDATNETVHILRGTTAFLSQNAVEPVMKIGSYVAGIRRLLQLVGLSKK